MSRLLLLGVGLLFPLISLQTDQSQISNSLGDRIVPVDILVLVALTYLAVAGKGLLLSHPSRLYLLTLMVSAIIAALRSHSTEEAPGLVTSFVALLMAFLYYVLGYNTARSRALTQVLLLGLAASVLWEAAIVAHDYFAPSQAKWFVDRMEYRVRGTFRTHPQLAAFGFSTAGLMFSVGWALVAQPLHRRMTQLVGALGVSFVIVTTRRSGIVALAWWLVSYTGLVWRFSRHWKHLVLPLLGAIGIGVAVYIGYRTESQRALFLVARMSKMEQQVADPEGFGWRQLHSALAKWPEWFPLGLGIGRSQLVDTYGTHEIHNLHVALLVDMGLLGAVAFYWLMLWPCFWKWKRPFGQNAEMVRARLLSFLSSALLLMLHNRLNRDRTFMLFLGLVSSLALRTDLETQQEGLAGCGNSNGPASAGERQDGRRASGHE